VSAPSSRVNREDGTDKISSIPTLEVLLKYYYLNILIPHYSNQNGLRVMLHNVFKIYRLHSLNSNPALRTTLGMLLTDCHNVCRCVRFKPRAIKISPLLSSFFPSSRICHRDNFIVAASI
jgi:hypothetical protein